MHFSPPREQKEWLKSKVASGDYATMAEVLREVIREKMRREERLQNLKGLIAEGDKGPFVPFDMDKITRKAEEGFDNQ